MGKKQRILFVCTGNSTRSLMAEGFARYYGGADVEVESAGTGQSAIHPYCQWAMNEAGIDVADQASDPLPSKNLASFSHVVTLCDEARDVCPVPPASVETRHWSLPDPEKARGRPTEVIRAFRLVRNEIERRVKELLTEIFSKT
ncbi:MAG: arsenate reductase ArsC, partial [Acidobacteriota bacterium]